MTNLNCKKIALEGCSWVVYNKCLLRSLWVFSFQCIEGKEDANYAIVNQVHKANRIVSHSHGV